jgi:hypothetical protein
MGRRKGSQSPPLEKTEASSVDAPRAVADDGGDWELGIHGSAGNLTAATAAERSGMAYWLPPASNWVLNYSYGESSAWEEDFKRNDLGGTNGSYIDSVDLQFYVGHGSPGGFTFDNASHDDGTLTSADCYRAWGDNDNEWLALTSCQVLGDSNISGWAACMYGQHLIMGFVTNASAYNNMSSTQAYHFGRYIMQNYSLPQAWYKACDVAQRGRTTRTIINELAHLNDKPNLGQVGADSFDTDWWYQTHACGTETAIYVPTEGLATMPVFQMAPYSLAEATADFRNLGNVFSIPVTPTLSASSADENSTGYYTSTAGSLALELDKGSGIYNFSDLGQLWTAAQAQSAMAANAAAANYIDSDDARTIADNFLRTSNLNGSGATFYEVISDTISSEINTPDPEMAAAMVSAATESPLLWQVIYSRRLTATVVSAAGVSEDIEFSVVGPGAKQKVYVPLTAPVGAASILETSPIGVQGGWREVAPAVNAATGAALTVNVMTPEQIQALYTALPEDVTLNDIPLDVVSREIVTYTVAYWEEASGVSQGQLIPVYELKVNMTYRNTVSGTQELAVSEEYVYVPASELYMRPVARIISTPAEPIEAGTGITLTAADATQTLRTLNLAGFDIVLGTVDPSYEWFLDGVKIGNGRVLSNFVVPFSQDNRNIELNFELRVTDLTSPNQSFSTDNVSLSGSQGIFLPSITR